MSNSISSITLCNVSITPSHQIDFNDLEEQKEYFRKNEVVTFSKCRYQPRTATIRVKGYVDSIQDCNYGYYTNTYRGNRKTFYFWIVARNYIAKEVTELSIQIDLFQTWLFNINFSPCMIEREMVENDEIGYNTIPEDFELGDYVTLTKKPIKCLQGKPNFLIGVTDCDAIEDIGGIYGHTYSGFILKSYSYDDYDKLSDFIAKMVTDGKGDAIAFIFTFPSGLYDVGSDSIINSIEGVVSKYETITKSEMMDFSFNMETYHPYNNKLYTHPFNFITVKNSSGGNVVLKLENFSNKNEMEFKIDGVVTQNPIISLTPLYYAGKDFAIDDSITMQEFGLCSWNNDNYANWFAQHSNSINAQSVNATSSMRSGQNVNRNNYNNSLSNRNTQAVKGGINTAINTATNLGRLNVLGAGASAVGGASSTFLDYNQNTKNASNDLANSSLLNNTDYQNTMRSILASVKDAQVQPNTCKGSTQTCGLDLARDTATFYIEQTAIKPEYAKIIDMYFQMFGYQVNAIRVPKLHTRERWNYIKTVNSNVFGEIPHEDVQALNDIMNNGLTVWHNEQYMYCYDTRNEVI